MRFWTLIFNTPMFLDVRLREFIILFIIWLVVVIAAHWIFREPKIDMYEFGDEYEGHEKDIGK